MMKDNIKLFIRKKSYKELGDTGLEIYIHSAVMGGTCRHPGHCVCCHFHIM